MKKIVILCLALAITLVAFAGTTQAQNQLPKLAGTWTSKHNDGASFDFQSDGAGGYTSQVAGFSCVTTVEDNTFKIKWSGKGMSGSSRSIEITPTMIRWDNGEVYTRIK